MKKLLSVLALLLSVTLAGPAFALHCLQYWPPPFQDQCMAYAPDPLPGFSMVSSSYTPVSGDFVMCTSDYGYCQKAHMGAGGFYNISSLAEWSYGSYFPMKHVKSCNARNTIMWDGYSFTGSSFTSAWSCSSWGDVPGGQAKSMSIQN